LGLAVDDRVEVLGGLAEGDHVVVRGSESLKSGAAVRVANVTPGSGK
jgi:multidrug efflux pump subunit AcrA (membrane-fusion protein)